MQMTDRYEISIRENGETATSLARLHINGNYPYFDMGNGNHAGIHSLIGRNAKIVPVVELESKDASMIFTLSMLRSRQIQQWDEVPDREIRLLHLVEFAAGWASERVAKGGLDALVAMNPSDDQLLARMAGVLESVLLEEEYEPDGREQVCMRAVAVWMTNCISLVQQMTNTLKRLAEMTEVLR